MISSSVVTTTLDTSDLPEALPPCAVNFHIVHRGHSDCWLHASGMHWIVFYEYLKLTGKPCFFAYKADYLPRKRDPWTVNNYCFLKVRTLSEAMTRVEIEVNSPCQSISGA